MSSRLTHVFEKGSGTDKDIDIFVLDSSREQTGTGVSAHLIKEVSLKWRRGYSLSQVCSSHYYVSLDDPVDKIIEELSLMENVFALGVTDQHGEAQGIIIRRELFDLVGRSYGKNFLEKKRARSVMKHVKSFTTDSHIFSVVNSIEEDLNSPLINYFLIKDKYQRFAGIFSSKDMMLFYTRTVNREMKMVQNIQRSIVEPEKTVEIDNNYIHGVSKPSREAGGDYYSIRQLDDHRLFYCVADVSGKGYPASLITSIIGSQLENTSFSSGLEESLMKLNNFLQRKFSDMGIFVTGLFVIYDLITGKAQVCDCGHQYFYLQRNNNLVKVKSPANPPLGLMDDLVLEAYQISLKSGDMLLILTDGLLEQTDEQGKVYPILRILKTLNSETRPSGLDVFEDILQFRGFTHQHDDMTLLVHKRI